MTTTKTDIRLLVSIDNTRSFGDNYLRFTGTPVIVEASGSLISCGRHDAPELHPELADFAVTAQNNYSADGEGGFYGFSVEYRNVFSVDIQRAEQMLKALRRITKHMSQLATRLGYAQDIATYAAYAMDLFVTSNAPFVRHVTEEHDISGKGYRGMDANSLRYWVQDEIAKWQKANANAA
jgi:hypothetical protein